VLLCRQPSVIIIISLQNVTVPPVDVLTERGNKIRRYPEMSAMIVRSRVPEQAPSKLCTGK
jgi:hypothetical protein